MAEILHPIIVDLGKKKNKRIKELKRGEGKLSQDVAATVDQVRADLKTETDGREVVPVVVIYRKKSKKRGSLKLPFRL